MSDKRKASRDRVLGASRDGVRGDYSSWANREKGTCIYRGWIDGFEVVLIPLCLRGSCSAEIVFWGIHESFATNSFPDQVSFIFS